MLYKSLINYLLNELFLRYIKQVMVANQKNINGIFKRGLLFLCLITFIYADITYVDYNFNEGSAEYEHTSGSITKTIELDFSNPNQIPYYIKVTITPEEGTPTPLMCFAPEDATCTSGRHSLIKKSDGLSSMMYVRKEEFDSGELYIFVTCEEIKDSDGRIQPCHYKLKFEGGQAAEIDANSVFSYVVTNYNKEMKFLAMGTAEEGSYLTIGVEGSSSVQINVENQEDFDFPSYYLETGRITTFPIIPDNSNVLATFTIKGASVGDYLTLNIHVVHNEKAKDNLLYPNGPVVMGLLSAYEGFFREECFPISALAGEKYSNINKYYLTGKIYSKYALFWLADENNMYMEETEQEIFDGQLAHLIQTNGKVRSVCFEFSYETSVEMDYVAYSISILEPTKLEAIYNFYPPQTVGESFRRMIPKGGYAVYTGSKVDQSDKRVSFNMYNRKGVAEMYTTKCTTYPKCLYDVDGLPNLTRVKAVNKMSIWETTLDKTYEALDSEKYVMVVYCRDDDNEDNNYCEVDTSITTPGKTVNVIEKETLSKYVLAGDKGMIKLDFKGGMKIQRLNVDIMIYSGDVTFEVQGFNSKLKDGKVKDEEIEITRYKYYLSNKIFYHFNFAQLAFECVEIEYTAVLNSFFTVKYEINPFNLIQLEENIDSGESYLVEIDPTTTEKYKKVFLPNYRTKREKPFLANFFALNCEFEVTRKESENSEKAISFFDGYAQEIIYSDSTGYKSQNYEYTIKISETDLSNYNHKMCMLYVAGYESPDYERKTEIVVGENINQQIIFDDTKFKTVRFLYPHADPTKDLAIYINIIDQAYYDVNIFVNNEYRPIRSITITRSQIYYIPGNELLTYCPKDTLCNIIVEPSFSKHISSVQTTSEPMIEITIRQILNTPTYLQKSQAKKDFTCGDRLYYLYTDIGKNEIGEVSVNFLRDFGNVYGKVVRKDQTTQDEEANWRGIYRMPSKDWEDSLEYNGYTKKFEVGIEETQDCIEGCYLLLSIQVSQIGDYVDDSKFYPFSIITRITPNNRAYTDIPKVVIQVNEYIIGNVDVAENERIFQFYEVWLTHDSYRVEFDFQSEVAGLYINIGGTRPTTKNADFKLLPPGRDAILSIDKYNIIKKAEDKKIKIPNANSLQDINLVIGVWTDKTDSVDTEVFSLTVRLPNNDITLDIVEVNTDQKILCSPKYLSDNQFRCLFMITYDEEDIKLNMPLLVHAASVNQTAITHTHASFIESNYYDEFEVSTLRARTPTLETSDFSTQRSGQDYIYTRLGSDDLKRRYLYVNVISDKEDDIFILTSIPMYNEVSQFNKEFYPNPTTEQLLSVSNEKLRLKFFSTSSLIVNIVTLGGEAMVSWADEPSKVFNLRGVGDRIALTSGKISDEIIITKRTTSNQLTAEEDAGFVFYVSYYIRNPEVNFDEVTYGKSIEITYRETDLPVYLYSKVTSYFNDLFIAVTFMDSDSDSEGEFNNRPIYVKAALAKESTIYKSKQNPELSPVYDKTLVGIYDPAIRTAQVFLSRTIIQNYNIKLEDNPTLYLSLEKQEGYEKTFSQFNLEAQFTKVNGALIPVEKTFNYGRHSLYYTNYYRLRKDINKKYMAIEMSFNSDNLNYAINQAITRYNMSNIILKAEKARGKIFILLDTTGIKSEIFYLNFFRKEGSSPSPVLYNYVFKYINVASEDEFKDYRILGDDGDLSLKEEEKDGKTHLEITFNRIDVEPGKANITYFLKIVDNSTLFYGEECNSIALMESQYYTVYKRNPPDSNGKITLSATGDFSNWGMLQIIAQIQQDTILEFVAYNGIKNIRPAPKNSGDNSGGVNTSVFVVVAVILVALIAGLVVVVFIFQQRNKSLLNQVKHVSFQQNAGTTNTDPDLLLQKSQQSEKPEQ